MRLEYGRSNITIYGSKKNIEKAKEVLDARILRDIETEDRLVIQDAIDSNELEASILYDGNTIYSFERVIRDFKKALISKPSPITEYGSGDYSLTDYLYKFISQRCGTIAHFNKFGWIGTYPSKEQFKQFFRHNEFGHDILSEQPTWSSDSQRIAKEILTLVS